MTDKDFPFLTELGAEFRRAAHEQADSAVRRRRPRRMWRFASIPVLVAIAVIAYIVIAESSAGHANAPVSGPAGNPNVPPTGTPRNAKVPVIGFYSQAGPDQSAETDKAPPTTFNGTKYLGNESCVRMSVDRHLPPLVRSDAAPDKALMNELSMLRSASTPLDATSLGSWDRYPLLIETAFEKYARVFNAPEHVRLAFLPVSYCTSTQVSAPSPSEPGGVVRETRVQGLVMLVLSNKGEHPPVLVGTAQQIKRGPALAGLDVSNNQGFERAWLQTIVVPDGVAKVAMEFTSPYRSPRTISLNTTGNVGIAVRRFPYTPTIVYWYAADGRLIKKFVDRQQLAYHNCQVAHKKSCFTTAFEKSGYHTPKPAYHVASNNKQVGSPALLAQANALYRPVTVYKSSVTAAQILQSHEARTRFTKQINACDAPYSHQLFLVTVGSEKAKLYTLWSYASEMQTNQVTIAAFAPQLRKLASSWAALSLTNAAMNAFAHGTAAELNASLNSAPMNTCAFVRAIAAHHFSYTWARDSTYGVAATRWFKETARAGNTTSPFWRYITAPIVFDKTSAVFRAGGAGWRLFTHTQNSALANLPGEIG